MAEAMAAIRRAGCLRTATAQEVLCIVLVCTFHGFLMAEEIPTCWFPAVYTFGDSLTDNGNAVVAFSEQFMDSVTWPNGMLVPSYPAGRYCDGWLLTDYIGDASTRF
ncbi:hypothetical protein M758_12G001100 [Ceratodon purpureus]|nr:hypothetical protein M758_12G001100 [Ceratodon purpureus]